MMMDLDAATQEAAELGKANPLRDADKDLSDKLKPEHRIDHKSSGGESSTGLILIDVQNKSKVYFAYVSLLNLPTAVENYQFKGLAVRYYATGVSYSSFQKAIEIFRQTRSVDEVKDFLTPSLQEQEKNKYRHEKC